MGITEEKRESLTAWGLGCVGLVKGAYEVYAKPAMQDPRNEQAGAKLGWAAIGGVVIAWDLLARKTLTAEAHDTVQHHPLVARAAIGVTALHLMGAIPAAIDPIDHVGKRARTAFRGEPAA